MNGESASLVWPTLGSRTAKESRSILSVESNQNVESKAKNVESKIAFSLQEIRKVIKIVASICQILS